MFIDRKAKGSKKDCRLVNMSSGLCKEKAVCRKLRSAGKTLVCFTQSCPWAAEVLRPGLLGLRFSLTSNTPFFASPISLSSRLTFQ